MKRSFIALLAVLSYSIAFTQHRKQSSLEFYSLASGKTFPYRSGPTLAGDNVTPDGNGYYNVGVNYIKPLNKWLSVLGGVEFSNQKITTTYKYFPDPTGMPIVVTPLSYEKIQMFSFSVNVETDFWKYFYARSGFLIDAETKNNSSYFNNQSGLGLNIEVGAKYSFKNHVTIFLSPFFEKHGAILFHPKQYAYKINNAGINLGIGYKF